MRRELSNRSKYNTRKTKLEYYLLITDTAATEKNYFEGLKQSLPSDVQNKIEIKIMKSKMNNLLSFAKEQVSRVDYFYDIWIILDRDQVQNFDNLINEAQINKINAAWTNPCIEEWFYAYFDKIPPIVESTICCKKFSEKFHKVTNQNYKKSDIDIYKKLNQYGNEKLAIRRFEERMESYSRNGINKPTEMTSCGTIHILVSNLKKYCNS